ncbi:hypothetical protein [Agarivorans sp.]|uniref:hypothetical protein n=1 Tax=Agarivorans sp. TaxID=1872412 RepID=UPI003CFDBF60
MLSSNASKCEFCTSPSLYYLLLIIAGGLLQLVILALYAKLIPLLPACLLADAVLLYHWWHYRPRGIFSASGIEFISAEQSLCCTWSSYSRVAKGACCLICWQQQKLIVKVIFADSLPNQVYRKLCFVVNFPQYDERPEK